MTELDLLEESIGRMRRTLDLGTWPSGLPITSLEREELRYHLELARAERRRQHARQAVRCDCAQVGVHVHPFRGPHSFTESIDR